ncbi:MAG: DUF177 domain-containing protein [Myxococcota bacterium]|nr:DUF177 domain-containing protein [Myxococcota bacterium]
MAYVYDVIHLTLTSSRRTVRVVSLDASGEWCIQVKKSENKKKSSRGQLAVTITELKGGPVALRRSLLPAQLVERMQYCEYEVTPERAEVNLELEICGDGVLVRGSLDVDVKTQCGTCLADTSIHLTPEVSAFMTPKPDVHDHSDTALTPEALENEWFDGETVILDDLVYDTLMLELPMNPKCGSACPGIRTETPHVQAGNVDPRLAPLATIKIEKER